MNCNPASCWTSTRLPTGTDGSIYRQLHTTAFVSGAFRGDWIAGLHAWRTGLSPCTTKLSEAATGREVGNPNMIVTINGHRPSSPDAATSVKWRTGHLGAIRPYHRDATLAKIRRQPINHDVINVQ